jgi:ascorbate-specific PTS system EIIC-type component UlaA
LALISVVTGFIPLVMGLWNVFGKTHDHRKVRKCTNYRCSTSPGGIRVIVFIFSQGRHYCKDDRINGGEETRLGKELKIFRDNLIHTRRS